MLAELQELLMQSYNVERELGGGGMSRVFVATDLRLGRRVVIKLLPREQSARLSVDRFQREIRIAAKLRHPHIVPLLDAGEVGDTLYYTMPLIEGESIRDRLQRDRRIPLQESIRLCADVADALAYSHRQGVVHRDIKPENIMIDSGHAVVTDFGIARAIVQSNANALTADGFGVGTVGYMSPEQASGEGNLDGRSDVYSLACVLYEMVTGRSPRPTGQNIVQAAAKANQFGRLLPVLSKALATDRERRFESASQFRDALEKYTEVPRRRYVTALALVGAVVATVGVLWAYGPRPGPAAVSWQRRQMSAVGSVRSAALSPDGQYVAYAADNTLYITDVTTAETRPVATGDALTGVLWTRAGGALAFQSLGVIYTVPRAGGATRILTAQSKGEFAISEDGKHIAWTTTKDGRATLSIGSLGSDATSAMAVDTSGVASRTNLSPLALRWSPDGEWLAVNSSRGLSILSRDMSKQISIASSAGGLGEFVLDESGHESFGQTEGLILGQEFPFLARWMSWSPGGDSLYFDGWRAEVTSAPVVAVTTRSRTGGWSAPIPVDTPANYRGTEFSADRRRFAFIAGERRFQLFRYTLEGSRATRRSPVAPGVASDRHHDFSPDGRMSAFVREFNSRSELYVIESARGGPRRMTRLNATSLSAVRWSPDGTLISFIYDSAGSKAIGVVNAATGDLKQFRSRILDAADAPRSDREVSLGWAPDGARLFFGVRQPARSDGRSFGAIGELNIRSGRDSLVDSSNALSLFVLPSGNEIGLLGGTLTSLIWLDSRTGRRDSTLLPVGERPIRWERGGSLVMMRADSTYTEVLRFSPASRSQTLIADLPSRCLDVSLSPDGRTAVCEEVDAESEVWVMTRVENRSTRRGPF
jgi:Tol biopolymer transport system component